jgi:hypothetical protein
MKDGRFDSIIGLNLCGNAKMIPYIGGIILMGQYAQRRMELSITGVCLKAMSIWYNYNF